VEVHGDGPTVLLPVNPQPVEGPQADELRRWGADPALGRSLIDGLSDAFQVVAFDYEGQVLQVPKPDTLTPANLAGDLLAVADAAGADRFAYYGYSWLALAGLQLAIRTDRLAALVIGGRVPTNRRAICIDAARHHGDPRHGQLGLGAQHRDRLATIG
jgi:pimeloyl-ACP methyl ester carboxylesterase